ncbi:MAG TPA: hypothetical protein VMN77_01940 [Nitrospiria bacterium]|jgi:hypothetical protein|nr:hypothetical protein [Nitrospiria bacterium]
MLLLVCGIAAALGSMAFIVFGLWNLANYDVQDRKEVWGGTVHEETSPQGEPFLNRSLLTQ